MGWTPNYMFIDNTIEEMEMILPTLEDYGLHDDNIVAPNNIWKWLLHHFLFIL